MQIDNGFSGSGFHLGESTPWPSMARIVQSGRSLAPACTCSIPRASGSGARGREEPGRRRSLTVPVHTAALGGR